MLHLVNNELDLLCDKNERLIVIYTQIEQLNKESDDDEVGGQSDLVFESALAVMGLEGIVFSEKNMARLKILYRKSWTEEQKDSFIVAMMSD